MIPEVQLQSPWRTFEQRFQEYRCCDDKDFKRELIIASLPYIIISILSILYVMGGAAAFSLIDESISDNGFASRCFFVFSTLTTIGYGDVSPGNTLSKIFCMFYVSVGIPLLLLALTHIGQLFAEFHWTLTLSVFNLKVDPESRRKVPVPIITVFLLLHALVGGFLFCYWIDELPFLTSVYFSFVSITTIGFGDVIVKPKSDIDTVVLIAYLAFGIIIMSMFVNSLVHHAEWVHYLGRRKMALRKKSIWFGAGSLTVQQLVQLVAKNLNVSPKHLRRTLRDLDHIINLALQDDLRKRSNIICKRSSIGRAFQQEDFRGIIALRLIHSELVHSNSLTFVGVKRQISRDCQSTV
uniref:Ion_trans_2 domain-containing protein n=1 Tax=Haemonchus contortus TaxID=6289 RepID=A0A7I4XYZ0_HAECO|nr:Ion transport 2 domain containing protein [Haemonchus contortus]